MSAMSFLGDEGTPYEHVVLTDGETGVRARVKHTNTIREGWRAAETSVEIMAPSLDAAQAFNWHAINRAVFAAACEEAHRRNQIEGVG